MKKAITLLFTSLMAICSYASIWKASAETSQDANTTLVNDPLLVATTTYATTLKSNGKTIDGETFTHYIQVRNIDYPSGDNPKGTENAGSTSIVIKPQKAITLKFYYRRQAAQGEFTSNDGKDVKLFNQDGYGIVDGTLDIHETTEDLAYGFATKEYKLSEGESYVLSAKGTTINLYGFYYTDKTESGAEQFSFSWNFSNWQAGDISATTTIEGLTVEATPEKKVTIDGSKKTVEGVSYTQRLKFGGSGTLEYRNVHFDVPGSCTIKIVAAHASGSGDDRTLNIAAGSFSNIVDNTTVSAGADPILYAATYKGDPTTIYIYSANSGINLYAIYVESIDDGGEEGPAEGIAYDWDFTTFYDSDVPLLNGDTDNWTPDVNDEGEVTRWNNVKALSNQPLVAVIDGQTTELSFTKGLTFTAGAKGKLRVERTNKRLGLNGKDITVTLPSLKAGQIVTVVSRIANSSAFERRLSASNLYVSEGFLSSEEDAWVTNIGVVAKDGPVSFTTLEGGVNLQSIKVATIPESYTITIGEAGWSTFVSPLAVSLPDNLKAYTVISANDGTATLIDVNAIEAKEPVLLYGAAGEYTLNVIDQANATHNLLKASTSYFKANGSQYVLANGSKGIGFYKAAQGTIINGGKGYLSITGSASNEFVFGIEDGIHETVTSNKEDNVYYNLQGVRVDKPTMGVYIVNGKKVVLK